jgi:tripartite ATP-independent transporter DctM subunit
MNSLLVLTVFLLVLLVPILLGVPVVYSLGFSSLLIMLLPLGPDFSTSVFSIRMLRGSTGFILLAIPFYLFAGRLLSDSGATEAIFDFAKELVGSIQGGMGHVNIFASIIFSGMSGSAVADAAGLGTIEYEMMTQAGYDDGMAVSITGSSAIIGPIMPPSIPFIIYGVLAGVSIGDLFLAGIIPALLIAGSLMILVYIQASRRGYETTEGFSLWAIGRTLISATPALLTVVLIIGGILTGFFTATEAGAVAVVWSLLIGFIFYGESTLQSVWDAAYETMVDMGAFLSILATAAVYSYTIIVARIPEMFVDLLLQVGGSSTSRLFLIVLALIFLGMIMEPLANLILVVPILAPNFAELGIDPLHAGVVITLTLMIGLVTPPVGAILFVLERVTDVPQEKISAAMVPYYIPLIAVLLLLIVFPKLVVAIPNLV